ncbi:nitrogenase component 1 [Azospirillum argentinense]
MPHPCVTSSGASARHGGGCAFCGAKMALQPIADALHLVHGPAGCLGHVWEFRLTGSSGAGHHRHTMTTDLSELDVVMGGERKLVRAIETLIGRHRPAAVFVYQTCVPALIGDDVAAACRRAQERTGTPVIAVPLSGQDGGKHHGTQAAGNVLLDRVIGTREPERTTSTDVVLIGEYNVAGELTQITPLLEALGIRLLATIPGDGRFAAIAGAHRARATVALCSRALGGLAETMRDRFGIPIVQGSFYGTANVSRTLRSLAALLAERGGPADLPARADTLIRREEARVETALRPYRERLAGKRALLATGGIKSWSLAEALQHIGLEVVGSSVHKTSPEECRRTAALVGKERLMDGLPPDPHLLGAAGLEVDVILSGGPARYAVMRSGIPWVEINHERRIALSGYDGTLRLADEVDATLRLPLWRSLRAGVPWDGDGRLLARHA